MELKFVIPNMAKSLGNLEFGGPAEVKRGDTRRNGTQTKVLYRRYKLFSDVQRAEDIEVVIDGATYTYSIPQILWEAGKRYIYSVTMRSNDAEIGGENGQSVTIEGWTSTEEDITLVPVK